MSTLKHVLLLGSLIAILVLVSAESGRSIHKIIDRHNLGFLWKKVDQISVSTASAKLILHYQLPERLPYVDERRINCSADTRFNTTSRQYTRYMSACHNMYHFLLEYRRMRIFVQRQVRDRLVDLYDVSEEFGAITRSKRGFLTDALSTITGLATYDEVNDVRDILLKVSSGVETAARAWKAGTNHFMAAVQLEKKRLDNIDAVIAMQRKDIISLQGDLVMRWQMSNTKIQLYTQMLRDVVNLSFQLSEIDGIYMATNMLASNKLQNHLVHHSTLTESLRFLQLYPSRVQPNLRILFMNHHFYYTDAQ